MDLTGDTESIAEGSYGCTFKANLKDENGTPIVRAVKVQIVPPKDKEKISNEIALGIELTDTVKQKQAPGVIQLFEEKSISVIPEEWLNASLKKCPNFYQRVQQSKAKNIETEFVLIVMEFANGGSLQEYVSDILTQSINPKMRTEILRNISFQIGWTLMVLENRFGFRHFDLKTLNIVLSKVSNPTYFEFNLIEKGSTPQKWNLGIGGDINLNDEKATQFAFKHQIKLIDFGVSKFVEKKEKKRLKQVGRSKSSVESRYSGTRPWFDPSIYFVSREKMSRNMKFRRSYEADMWALGIMMIEMTLANWSHPIYTEDFKFGKSPEMVLVDIPKLQPDKTNLNMLSDKLRTREDISNLQLSDDDLAIIITMCCINHAFGNGLLPTFNEWPELKETPILINFLTENKKYLEKIGSVSFLSNVSTTETENIFTIIADYVRNTLGTDGFDLIRRLLQWSPLKRGIFGSFKTKRNTPHYFASFIEHPFFDPYYGQQVIIKTSFPVEKSVWSFSPDGHAGPLKIDDNVKNLIDILVPEPSKIRKTSQSVKEKLKNPLKNTKDILNTLASTLTIPRKIPFLKRKSNIGYMIMEDKESTEYIAKLFECDQNNNPLIIWCNSCQNCEASYKCSQCKSVNYCSSACQRIDWPAHYKSCNFANEIRN